MKVTTETMPPKIAVTKCQESWLLTVNLDIEEVENGYECDCFTVELDHKPAYGDAFSAIIDHINGQTDVKILTGYSWNGKNVWLSSENQFNFKAAYDVAVQTEGATLPMKFKLGEDEDAQPVYHTFKSLSAFTEFYTGAISFIQRTLAEGWVRKDSVNNWLKDVEL